MRSRMKSVLSLLVSFMLCAGAACTIALICRAQTSDEDAIRGTVARFFAAYRAKDTDSLMRLWKGGPDELSARRKAFEREFKADEPLRKSEMAITQINIDGTRAVARFIVTYVPEAPNAANQPAVSAEGASREGVGTHRSLRLIRDSESWKVSDYLTTEEEVAEAIAGASDDDQRRKLLDENAAFISMDLVRAVVSQGQSLVNHSD